MSTNLQQRYLKLQLGGFDSIVQLRGIKIYGMHLVKVTQFMHLQI